MFSVLNTFSLHIIILYVEILRLCVVWKFEGRVKTRIPHPLLKLPSAVSSMYSS